MKLSADETAAIESILSEQWGMGTRLTRVETVWGRDHVGRVTTTGGRTAIVKRPRNGERRGLVGPLMEQVALEFLNESPAEIAPRLYGATKTSLVLEDLPPGRSLADSLLGVDRTRARNDLVAYGEGLAKIHVWSLSNIESYRQIADRHGLSPAGYVRKVPFFEVAAEEFGEFEGLCRDLGLEHHDAAGEIGSIPGLLAESTLLALVHGDACPDNVMVGDPFRIFDWETASLASPALDLTALVAPFPSCWCFARLPRDITDEAVNAYCETFNEAGVTAARDLARDLPAALAWLLILRSGGIRQAVVADSEWGTAGIRARALVWIDSFLAVAAESQQFPALHQLLSQLRDHLAMSWLDAAIPEYPAFSDDASVHARPPDWWLDVRSTGAGVSKGVTGRN